MKQKKCRHCGELFIPRVSMQAGCSIDCAIEIAVKKRVKKDKIALQTKNRELIAQKEAIRSRSEWIKDVQKAVNLYIRTRDKGKNCISCDRPTKPGDHAGHWKPTSSSPELRFCEENIHLQCIQCNLHLHGNVANYRTGLVRRIGLDRVEWLESKHEPAKWTIQQLKEIKAEFKRKLKDLQNEIL